jgi:phenylpropionate dioxygenase-like ring-hydroxylating dioxygenase large terminal subunit
MSSMMKVALAIGVSLASLPYISCFSVSSPVAKARMSHIFSSSPGISTMDITDSNTAPSPSEQPISDEGPEKNGFANFDYMAHWYPVVWAQDVPENKPTKVTLFDVDYVVAKLADGSVICMEDRCAHKSAALSEGRVTSSGNFQCAYHGWSFDGTDGACVEIPQTASLKEDGEMSLASFSSRTNGIARPIQISQGMVWVFPGGDWADTVDAPPPPTIPELDLPGFRIGASTIRDFPIDFSVLMENIMDPDHGLFTHGATAFDEYSASSSVPQTLEEEFVNGGKGWQITSRVTAVEKVLKVDKTIRGTLKKIKPGKDDEPKIATTTFKAPNLVYMGRRDKETGETALLVSFLICPVGVGRTRFMSGSISKLPFSPPRWFFNIIVNNFLDQDTHLLETQQKHVLNWEAKAVKQQVESGELASSTESVPNTMVRKKNFVYRSPSEKMSVRVGAFFDATLSKSPNRVDKLMELDLSANPKREMTLDRRVQHLNICPDSQGVVKNCDRIIQMAKFVSLAVAAVKAVAVSRGAATVGKFLSPPRLGAVFGMSLFANWLAKKMRREFFFKYTEALRDRDLAKTPKNIWLDKIKKTSESKGPRVD